MPSSHRALIARNGREEGRIVSPERKMNRKIALLLVVCALFTLFALPGSAASFSEPLRVDYKLSPTTLTGPGTVHYTITVTNIGDSDLPDMVKLLGPDGNVVPNFGDGGGVYMRVGDEYSVEGDWNVTQDQLDAGSITFQFKYGIYENDVLVNKNKFVMMPITYKKDSASPTATPAAGGTNPKLEIVRHDVSPTVARKDQEVTVTYVLKNTGDTELREIKLSENSSITNKSANVSSLAPGAESEPIVFTKKMGTKELTSQAKVTYKAVGSNKTHTVTADAIKVQPGQSSLTPTLTASAKGVNKDDTVQLTLSLKNSGTLTYTIHEVTDPVLGVVFSNLTVGPNATITETKDVVITEDREFLFTISGVDSADMPLITTTDKVTVASLDPTKNLKLAVNATANRTAITADDNVVTFTVTVTNNGGIDAKDVIIRQAGTTVATIELLPMNSSVVRVIPASLSMAGNYKFTATSNNIIDVAQTFDGNMIEIRLESPLPQVEATPTPPPPTPPTLKELPTAKDVPSNLSTLRAVMLALFYIFAIAMFLSLVLMIVAKVRRVQQENHSKAAMDHLERGTRRDYTVPSEDAASPVDGEEIDPDNPPAEADDDDSGLDMATAASSSALPHEKYLAEDDPAEEAPQEAETPSSTEDAKAYLSEAEANVLSGGTGQYRLQRQEGDKAPADSTQAYARRRRAAKAKGAEGEKQE